MDTYLSFIAMFGFGFAPRGWATCNGQILSIAQNTALFSLLGTTYGGNGQTTFALPDLRGRAPMHWGQLAGGSTYVLGQQGGVESTTLISSQLPLHTHTATAVSNSTSTSTSTMYAEAGQADLRSPEGNMFGATQPGKAIYKAADASQNRPMHADCIATTTNTTTTTTVQPAASGGSQPVALLQPYLAVTFAICTQGLFPPRN